MRHHRVFDRSLDQAINEIQELRDEVDAKLFIPKRFRSKPFTEPMRKKFVEYLDKELFRLKEKLKFQKKGFKHGQNQKNTQAN